MVNRTDLLRVCTGIILGLLLGVVIQQARQRDPQLYASLLSQGAFGGTTSEVAINSSAAPCHGAGDNCDDGAGCCDGYECTSPDNQNFTCTALSSSSSAAYCCSINLSDATEGACIATVPGGDDTCYGGGPVYDTPDCDAQCPSSSSSSSSEQQYCCAFDGSGCIAAPDNDPANDACDQNHTGYADNMCNGECVQQWCCAHVLPRGPGNCSQM